MKMNAFLRLINALACGAIVVGATHSCNAQSATRDDVTYGSLQPADENGNGLSSEAQPQVIGDEATTVTQEQVPYLADGVVYGETVVEGGGIIVPQNAQPMVVPNAQIPMTEVEIPGSAYFVGPDGNRIDESELNQAQGIVGESPIEGLSPAPFSPDAVYDGTQAFPMGTFPTTPFGERIISEEPVDDMADADTNADSDAATVEIPGEVVDSQGSVVDSTPIVVPPSSEDSVADATSVVEPPASEDKVGEETPTINPPTPEDSYGEAPGELKDPMSTDDGIRVLHLWN